VTDEVEDDRFINVNLLSRKSTFQEFIAWCDLMGIEKDVMNWAHEHGVVFLDDDQTAQPEAGEA
jgi:hypothetical protein